MRSPLRHTLGVRPEQPHETPHLDERLPTRLLDAAESRQGLLGLRSGDPLRRSGLGDDDAHVVRDHIVQFPSDHAPFFRYRTLGPLLALTLQAAGPIL